jgi:1-acyl-sn-glycerol-3-phosphate acyltransferase
VRNPTAIASGLLRRAQFPLRAPTTPGGVEPVPAPGKTGADYDTDWARRYPARMARVALVEGVMRPAAAVLAAPQRRGAYRLHDIDGPAIFAPNHHSHLDTPLMLTSIPEPWRHKLFVGAGADYFFTNRVTGAASALAIGAIPIERKKVTRRSADQAAALIDEGWSMLIFPEGGRSPDGWGQPFRGGAAYLALRCDIPVVPVHLRGTGRILRKGKKLPTPSSTIVTFGDPLRAESDEDSRHLAARIEDAVAALADETTTDWYQARRRAHQKANPTLGGPDVSHWRRAWAMGDTRRGRKTKRRWPI